MHTYTVIKMRIITNIITVMKYAALNILPAVHTLTCHSPSPHSPLPTPLSLFYFM